jgi:hypothetical protein
MQSVRSIKNQYPGINAHLHSYWQGAKKWNRFHNVHIADLMKLLRAQLRPMGYTATIEESLQIRRTGESTHEPKSDLLIRDMSFQPAARFPRRLESSAPVITIEALLGDEDREHPYSAVAIYVQTEEAIQGEPVAWIEILSPTNKRGGPDTGRYVQKRDLLLQTRLVFIELDYLHETPPTFWRLADYSHDEIEAFPYRIVVADPLPDEKTGLAYPYEFSVDQSIPTVKIPLNGDDVIDFDFNHAYRKTFEESLYGDDVDYNQLPMNFDRYHPDDQAKIVSRMIAVIKAAREGVDLEAAAPLTVELMTLEAGLKQLAEWTA